MHIFNPWNIFNLTIKHQHTQQEYYYEVAYTADSSQQANPYDKKRETYILKKGRTFKLTTDVIVLEVKILRITNMNVMNHLLISKNRTIPHFLGNLHTYGSKAVSPTLQLHFTPRKILWYSFLLKAEKPQHHNAVLRIR
jgi:hypothetical protein